MHIPNTTPARLIASSERNLRAADAGDLSDLVLVVVLECGPFLKRAVPQKPWTWRIREIKGVM